MGDAIGPRLASVRHPTLQRLRRLSGRRSARTNERAFVVDGPTLLDEALEAGVAIDEVVAEAGCPTGLLERARAAGATVRRVHPGVLARATDTVTPQLVAAIAHLSETDPDDAARAAGPLALVLVGVADPGNAGTLLRSAEAAGAGAVLFCDGSVDPYSPKAVRASAGSLFRIAVTRAADAVVALRCLEGAGLTTVSTLARAAPAYDEVDLARPVALVLGSEAHGLPEAVVARVSESVTIPMAGPTESLNVGMAGTVLCFESLRQRRLAGRASAGRAGAADRSNRLDETPPQAAGCTGS
jgi:TrmH family RNA methyltransferase